jgi:hypothetical protein
MSVGKLASVNPYLQRPDCDRRFVLHVSVNVTDDTRTGERGVSPFELQEKLSGEGACDIGQIPRVVLWRFVRSLLHGGGDGDPS